MTVRAYAWYCVSSRRHQFLYFAMVNPEAASGGNEYAAGFVNVQGISPPSRMKIQEKKSR
ncbi:hypothetical protein J1614_004090 [Plenodomus biglobosus]|nr:hypothetical protein J1614_004090 [Plenodomus biglobosus]